MARRRTETAPINGVPGHTRVAYEGLRRMLFHSEIVPGQKISYRDLSERLGMSQTPVIQALKWLEFQHLVCHEPNRGYYIAPISLQEVEEIYDFRELIELDLLSSTIARIDAAGVARLRAALEAHALASREEYLYDRLLRDMEYHLTLASLSGRLVPQQALTNLFDLLYLKYGGKFLFHSLLEAVDEDHREIFERVAQKDREGAGRVLSGHIRRVKTHVLRNVERVLAATRL